MRTRCVILVYLNPNLVLDVEVATPTTVHRQSQILCFPENSIWSDNFAVNRSSTTK